MSCDDVNEPYTAKKCYSYGTDLQSSPLVLDWDVLIILTQRILVQGVPTGSNFSGKQIIATGDFGSFQKIPEQDFKIGRYHPLATSIHIIIQKASIVFNLKLSNTSDWYSGTK
jgi:hypothetical protein